MTENGSYFVWIPRYAYRITYYESKEKQKKELGYYDGYGMWSAEGTLRFKLDDNIETIDAEDGNRYIVHPAFGTSKQKEGETDTQYLARKTYNINNGGWGDTLTGFWFAKFEMSGTSAETLKSSPNGNSIRYRTAGQLYTIARNANYGQTGTIDNFDGKTSFMNSHMIKNSEWGAVAYLTHSKFGVNGENIVIDKSNQGTGGGEPENSYIINQNQSTTGNVYGIYDMSGGAAEFTAAYNNAETEGNLEAWYNWTSNTGLTITTNSTKYATRYENNTSNYLVYEEGKVGDATKEVYSGEWVSAWGNNVIRLVNKEYPLQMRGTMYSNSDSIAGLFEAFVVGGLADSKTLRTVLCP